MPFSFEFSGSFWSLLSEIVMPADKSNSPPHVSLHGRSAGMMKKLPGYKKHHFVPEGYSDAAQNFVRTIGAERVKATADDLCLALREH